MDRLDMQVYLMNLAKEIIKEGGYHVYENEEDEKPVKCELTPFHISLVYKELLEDLELYKDFKIVAKKNNNKI